MNMRAFIRRNRAEIDAVIRGACGRGTTINDIDREEWIANDEGLYNWARSEGAAV